MIIIMENLHIILPILGLGILSLALYYIYSLTHPRKSIFQKPTDHLEIRSWKIK